MKNRKRINSFVTIALLSGCCLLAACNSGDKTATPVRAEIPKPFAEPANPYVEVDKSPMDISYYPVNYPKQLIDGNDSAELAVRVIYSRPHKMGRTIFGNEPPPKCIQQYGAYWRLGANEATEIEFFKPAAVNGQKIPKGRYIIYCIPFADKWTIVLNSNLFSFGLHQDASKDIMRFEIPVQQTNENIEFFTMMFQKSAIGADLVMVWGNVKALLPIAF